jgi:hypothetical protein
VRSDPTESETLAEDIQLKDQPNSDLSEPPLDDDDDHVHFPDKDDNSGDESDERHCSENEKEEQHIEVVQPRYQLPTLTSMADATNLEAGQEQVAVATESAGAPEVAMEAASPQRNDELEENIKMTEEDEQRETKEDTPEKTEDKDAKYKLLLKTLR